MLPIDSYLISPESCCSIASIRRIAQGNDSSHSTYQTSNSSFGTLGTLNFIFLADEDQSNHNRDDNDGNASQQAVEEVH
jgi:hypothetical protein